MLPTAGFFKDIDCPYYENTCARPYCHFRHRKRSQEPPEEPSPPEELVPEVPTYKPTPKSELASSRSHIPISYVPDLVVRKEGRSLRHVGSYNLADRPTYNPTPISLLSSTNIAKESEYTPMNIACDSEINLDDLSTEFEMIDEILGDKAIKVDVETKPKEKDKKPHSKHHSDKRHDKKSSSSSSKDKRKEEHRKDKYSRSSSKHKDKEKDKSREKLKVKEREKTKEKECEKSKTKERSSSSSSHKSKSKVKEKDKESKDKRKKDKNKSKDTKSREHKLVPTPSPPDSHFDNSNYLTDDDLEDESIESECYKIFNEYTPPLTELPEEKPTKNDSVIDEIMIPNKKRVAYEHANNTASKTTYNKPKEIPTAGLIMTNRYRIARQAQSDNEQKYIQLELKKESNKIQTKLSLKRPHNAEHTSKHNKIPKLSPSSSANGKVVPKKPVSLIDEIISGKQQAVRPRIAPVSNVYSIQRAKAKLDEMVRTKSSHVAKTTAQITKGSKRVAHVPDASLTELPDVLSADKSKLPVNVRTRYLTMLADECIKLYVSKADGYQRALNEEFKCYEKCSVLVTYRNSAMLAVNRLRKEILERENSGRGPIQEGEETDTVKSSPFQGKQFYNNITSYLMTDEELVLHGYPREGSIPGRAIISGDKRDVSFEHLESGQRICCRCRKLYLVDDDGFALVPEACVYHPLKKRTLRGERTYLCCKSSDDTGCAMSNTHVSEASADRELEGYQSTMEPERDDDPRSYAVYALDCEMCYTTKGLELTRVTIVDTNLKTVYESLVKPLNAIIDYNTRFSGITKDQMDRTSTSILQVQANILHLCNSRTILIGHSLESDMKALKIIHSSVIDTSVMFPHKLGLPHKRALRVLASDYLKKIIQNGIAGHDSAEDALACMELVIWKVKEELKVKGIKT